MTRRTRSIENTWFESLYQGGADPWAFATSEYERAKYAATLAALGPGRIPSAWEVGCAIGVFTRALAAQCDRLLAVDVAESALAQARRRCADLAHVSFARQRVPDEWPTGRFDLIAFSEVLYYLDAADIGRTARQALASLTPRGRLLLVHWTGETDYPVSGDAAAELFRAACGDAVTTQHATRHPSYRLDILARTG